MRPWLGFLVAVALPLAFTPGYGARADLVHWSYRWSSGPDLVFSNSRDGTGAIVLTDQTPGWRHARGPAAVTATTVGDYSSAPPWHPDRYTARPFHLTLVLEDDLSRATQSLTFRGVFSGSLSIKSGHITAAFLAPTTQKVHLGHYWYTVTIGPFVEPPLNTGSGFIKAEISMRHNPEPSSLALGALGLGALGLAGLVRRVRGKKYPTEWDNV